MVLSEYPNVDSAAAIKKRTACRPFFIAQNRKMNYFFVFLAGVFASAFFAVPHGPLDLHAMAILLFVRYVSKISQTGHTVNTPLLNPLQLLLNFVVPAVPFFPIQHKYCIIKCVRQAADKVTAGKGLAHRQGGGKSPHPC